MPQKKVKKKSYFRLLRKHVVIENKQFVFTTQKWDQNRNKVILCKTCSSPRHKYLNWTHDMEFTADTMQKLAELLRPPEPEVLQGSDLPASDFEITSVRDDQPPPASEEKKTPKTIEEYEEQEAREAEELSKSGAGLADRKVPENTMNYQQSVSAEDVFLQIGPKTPGSASCENLIVRIKMPGDKRENVDLSVDTTKLTVNSSRYSLTLPLPHGIDPDLSKANWDTAQETLVLTLKLDREFDYVNM